MAVKATTTAKAKPVVVKEAKETKIEEIKTIDKTAQENIELKAQMKALMEQLSKQQSQPNVQYVQNNIARSVKVMSLIPNVMPLSTDGRGGNKSKVYRFTKFGEILTIPFDDLQQIKIAHRTLFEAGAFYICDEQAVESLYATELYKTLATDEVIKNIVKLETMEDVDTLKTLNKIMQTSIIDTIIDNKSKGQNYDRNKLYEIKSHFGIDIEEKAEELKVAIEAKEKH